MRLLVVIVLLITGVSTADAQVLTVDTAGRVNAATTGLAAATATHPAAATELRDLVRFDASFDAATQGAGTPNRTGFSAFIPLHVGDNSVTFASLSGYGTFADFAGTSIIGTNVGDGSPGTSSRLGYRWLKDDRTWMYGVNVGFDSLGLHPAAPSWGHTTGFDETDVTFGQAALGVETVGERWELEATAAVGVGNVEQQITTYADAGVLDTYSARIGYHPGDDTVVSVGYYYQDGDLDVAGSGVPASIERQLAPALTGRLTVSHDHAYDTRVSGGLSNGFGGRTTQTQMSSWPLQALSRKPQAVVRLHDSCTYRKVFGVSFYIFPGLEKCTCPPEGCPPNPFK